MSRIYNFSAGPATLPLSCLEEARDQLVDYKGAGFSIMEASHRGKEYDAVHNQALDNLKTLMGISDDYSVLFLQGGATTQFAMIPMNLLGAGQTADYINCGAWAKKAIKEAQIVGQVNIAGDTGSDIPTRMPANDSLQLTDGAAYLHITSNETIGGNQYKDFPTSPAPLVADMSSDILSRKIDVNDFGLIYAGAQKNLGPSGLAVVVLRNDLAERVPETVPGIFRYAAHMKANSMLNTPPCFGIYMLSLTTQWMIDQGGVEAMQVINDRKAAKLYDAIDASDFYKGTAAPDYRSTMNVTFRIANEDLEAPFIAEAAAQGMAGLKGHRDVGGIRASIYNAFPEAGVEALVAFMQDFAQKNG
ncbi:MAG: phosphoserine aminotransferase [Candidatus Omnitrophota bacterium]|jgi:phosphoserine aminotransferase